jgi:hypothetical protein
MKQTEKPAVTLEMRPARKVRQVGRSKQSAGRSRESGQGKSKCARVSCGRSERLRSARDCQREPLCTAISGG